jgi:superfamily II DNA or RNA helicase
MFSKKITGYISDRVYLNLSQIPQDVHKQLHMLFERSNPDFFNNKRLGFSNYNTPAKLVFHFSEYMDLKFTGDTFCFPVGALEDVRDTLAGYTLKLDDRRLSIAAQLKDNINLLSHQIGAVNEMVKHDTGILVARCGSGKSILALKLATIKQQRTLICVHTKKLLEQWMERVEEFVGVVPGQYGAGKKEIKDITIGMIQTITRNIDSLKDKFGMVVFDECHHVSANTFYDIATKMQCKYRYGISATPSRKDQKQFLFKAALGPVRHKIQKAEVEKAGIIIPASIKIVKTNFECPEYLDEQGDYFKNYHYLLDKLIKDVERIKLIFKHLEPELKAGHKVLMLFDRFNIKLKDKFGEVIAVSNIVKKWEKWLCDKGYKALACTGGSKDNLNDIDAMFKDGRLQILIASTVADEGLDIKIIDRLFMCLPCKNNEGLLEQRVGRIERKYPDKEDAIAYYFLDTNIFGENIYRLKKKYKVEET